MSAPGGAPLRVLLLYAQGPASETLSYQHAWPRAFAEHRAFDVRHVDVATRRGRALLALEPVRRRRYDAVVLLHSVFSNEPFLSLDDLARARRLAPARVLFVGNEYKLMPEKIAMAEALGVTLLVTQLDAPEAHALYRERLGCAVLYLPYTGLDPDVFFPGPPLEQRAVDLGYRGYESPWYLGHRERTELVARFAAAAAARGLRADLSLDHEARLDERGWADFLRGCRAQLGSEAGGDYFELTDETRARVMEAVTEAPETSFEDIHARFFSPYVQPVSGRALSGRVVEAAGTKTTQLLLTGRYGGFFEPNVHYIPVRHDLADVEEALGALEDLELCRRLADAAHEHALTNLTYATLLDRLRGVLNV